MAQVKLKFHPYMRGDAEWHEVEATVRGDLAVHHWGMVGENGLSLSKSWTVSHIPTGESISAPLPNRFCDRGAIVALRKDLVKWAEEFQIAAPEFFEAARNGDIDAMRQLASDAMNKGKAL